MPASFSRATLAEDLYQAILETINAGGALGILAAAGDAKARVPWQNASTKTRTLVMALAANLTKIQSQR